MIGLEKAILATYFHTPEHGQLTYQEDDSLPLIKMGSSIELYRLMMVITYPSFNYLKNVAL
jgi:hypothetical protein